MSGELRSFGDTWINKYLGKGGNHSRPARVSAPPDVSRLVEGGTVNGAGASLARAPYKSWPPRSGKRLTSPGAIEGKLDVLRVECTKCDRKGRYHVHKLIERYGRKGNMMKWREMLNADCRSATPE
jgi:hypothetical protein